MGDKKSTTGFKIRNVLEALIVSIVLIVGVSSAVVVLTTGPEDSVHFIIGNETYIADETTNFNSITIDSSYIIFNNTGFYLTAPNDIAITLVYINDNIAGAGDADKIVEFLADTSGGDVLFDLSGFPAGNDYVVKRDGESFSYLTADSSGHISFSSIVDEDKRFEILQVGDGEGPGDTTVPNISNMNVAQSDPIDTESGFGWQNFTCTVTGNVDDVFLNIIYPDSITTDVSMINIAGTNQYYYNTSFSEHGNYGYFIWVDDTSDNTDISSNYDFSVPPNWDINRDGVCDIYDKTSVSNHYGETGAPGWIREDVDNNGQIQVFDLVLVSIHYGETW